jgi:hypothetical protein
MGDTKVKDFDALLKIRKKSGKWKWFIILQQTGAILVKR